MIKLKKALVNSIESKVIYFLEKIVYYQSFPLLKLNDFVKE